MVGGKSVLVIQIPRATRRQRPIYIGQNPITGTYRRNHEGDYLCTPDEVGRMLADQSEEPADSLILEHFGSADLDPESLQQYRNRFSARAPAHPWLSLDEPGLAGEARRLAHRPPDWAGGTDRRRATDVRQGRGDP